MTFLSVFSLRQSESLEPGHQRPNLDSLHLANRTRRRQVRELLACVGTQPIAVGSCSKEERSAPQRKRYRENEADIAEDMQLGKIRGNGCGIVKACRMLPQPPAL